MKVELAFWLGTMTAAASAGRPIINSWELTPFVVIGALCGMAACIAYPIKGETVPWWRKAIFCTFAGIASPILWFGWKGGEPTADSVWLVAFLGALCLFSLFPRLLEAGYRLLTRSPKP